MTETPKTAFDLSPHERLEYERTLLRLLAATLVEGYLEDTGIQAQQLASRMHKSKSWVSKLLTGTHNPTLDTLADVATALGLRWNVKLCAIDREGTPASWDPEPPHWVEPRPGATSANVFTFVMPTTYGSPSFQILTCDWASGSGDESHSDWRWLPRPALGCGSETNVQMIMAGNQR